tara:strand:- start:570 stop:773 length:204 start_codon:yes stop_codon:yes gene_type:complete
MKRSEELGSIFSVVAVVLDGLSELGVFSENLVVKFLDEIGMLLSVNRKIQELYVYIIAPLRPSYKRE